MRQTRAMAQASDPRTGITLAMAVIVLAGLIAYGRTFSVPFLFDDEGAIIDNPSIRRLSDLGSVLSPPDARGTTVGGRPVLNLTLAVNYALTGDRVWSYHVFNLLVHIGAGLVLFGLVRRTLLRPRPPTEETAGAPDSAPSIGVNGEGNRGSDSSATSGMRGPGYARALALATSLLWLLHPLQTESVTYIVQRAESLMGFFYLLTLYAFARSTTSSTPARWQTASVVACLLGMGTKEVMVSAPIIVLLYDRTFFAGSLRAAWRGRRGYYLALGATWFVLGALVFGSHHRGGTAGLGELSSLDYGLTQFRAVVHYLRLALVPWPLVFDYGTPVVQSAREVWPQMAALLLMFAATVVALRRRSALGFLGLCFFAVLAPSSSVVPVATQTIAEHRMYLPLGVVVVLGAVGLHSMLGRRAWPVLFGAAAACALLTFTRNEVYRRDLSLWSDTILHQPDNGRAYFNLANAYLRQGRTAEAIASYEAALRVHPDYIEARNNLGAAFLQAGRPLEALPHFEAALQMHATAITHFACARTLAQLGRFDQALTHYDAAIKLQPDYPEALSNRGNLLLQAGHATAAVASYQAALRVLPNFVDARLNLATALLQLHRAPEAILACETAIRLRPDFGAAHWKLGDALLETARPQDAIVRYREAVRLDPSLVHAYHGIARALVGMGEPAAALPYFEKTLQLMPGLAVAHHNLAVALALVGRIDEGIAQDEIALQLQPDLNDAREHADQLRQRRGTVTKPVPPLP